MNIQVGQYWVLENGNIALVTHNGPESDLWLVKWIGKDGFASGIGISPNHFKQQISRDEAMRLSLIFMQAKIHHHFTL